MLPIFENKKRDHLIFRRAEIDRPRHKRISMSGLPPRDDNIQYGQSLSKKVEVVVKHFEELIETQPPEFDPALIFKVRVDSAVDENDWRRSNLTVLSEEPDGKIVLFSPDQLTELNNRISAYSEPISEGRKNPRYAWIAALTEDMELWSKDNRIGRKLRNIKIEKNGNYYLDIELWVYGTAEENQERFGTLKKFVEENGGKVSDRYIGIDLHLARVHVPGGLINKLLEIGSIREVDLPPEPAIEMPQYYHSRIDDFDTPVEKPDPNSPGICIIDSGIATGHPILANAVGDARSFPVKLGSEIDQSERGHGTMVAGLALYGDVQKCIEELNFSPQIFLYSARVLNSEDRFDDESLVITQIEQSISYFRKTYDCRIFNISLADPNMVYADGKPSIWASVLDQLARDYDVILVASTGNIPIMSNNRHDAEYIRRNYPFYLFRGHARILEPSTAVNVLTVGSICHSDSSFHAGRQPGDLIEPIGIVNMPSPFTRCGPGVNQAIKPDVVEYGGNCAWNGTQGRFQQNDPGLDIVSTNREFHNRLFAAMSGTSFSTPRIAHLAGLILKKYPGISANLVRALIANSAEIPEIAYEYFSNEQQIVNVYGYGLPNLEKALYSTDSRVVLMAEDSIPLDSIHLYEIPIPEGFKITKGERVISICLAYDPPVKHTRKEYTGVKLEFRLIRGCTTDKIFQWYSDQRSDETEPLPDKYTCPLQPSLNNRGGGTLHKARYRIRQNRSLENYPGESLYLLVQSKKNWATQDLYPEQKYSIVVTIEHLSGQLELYNFLRDRTRHDVRERARIR